MFLSDEVLYVQASEAGMRLDQLLKARYPSSSRSKMKQRIEQGNVTVNNKKVTPHVFVRSGDIITVVKDSPQEKHLSSLDIRLEIVYEDDALLVVNKPAGLVVHPAAGHSQDTLTNALLAYCPQLTQLAGESRFGLVHRLDKDTSGLLIVAKQEKSLQVLLHAMQQHKILKKYLTLLHGTLPQREGMIDAPIGRDPRYRQQMTILTRGRLSVTRFRVLEYLSNYTYAQMQLETGRTHQIRVHCKAIGHSVVGDQMYGELHLNNLGLRRQFLHAASLEFLHPVTSEPLSLSSTLPEALEQALSKARIL